MAQAGQKGISIPLSGDGQKMFILLGIVLFSSSGDGISFPGDGAAGGSQDVPTPPSFPGQVLSGGAHHLISQLNMLLTIFGHPVNISA